VKNGFRAVVGVCAVMLLIAATNDLPNVDQHFKASGPLTASDTGVTPSSIKIGYITPQSGVAASTFKGGDQGALARIKLQNAQGGIDGRKIQLVTADDGNQSNKTAAQDLVENQNVFGVIDLSPFLAGEGTTYLNQHGIPVTGLAFGSEWGQAPNSNMFSYTAPAATPFDGKNYTNDGLAKFLKSSGVTKLATLAFGISEASTLSIRAVEAASKSVGIKPCYENFSVQFGQTSFTTEALAIKQAGCDGVVTSMVDASDVGLGAALAQAGVTAKTFYYTGYDQSILDDPNASTALEGAYFNAMPNFTNPTSATKSMLAAIRKYAPAVPKGIPSLGVFGSYYAADLMIRGLQLAGQNPTRPAFISKLRAESAYTAGGLIPPVNLAGFATTAMFPAQTCTDYVQFKGGKFKTVKKNSCGKLFAYTR
jgi:ABC-type branched-subunit amino acid transport system substrate-binding protein